MDTDVETTLAPETLDRLRSILTDEGPLAAIDRLAGELLATENLQAYFFTKLLRKRVELGVSPFPSGPATEVPVEAQDKYESAIREAGRQVGDLYLHRRQFARAWGFFRLLDEPEPFRKALQDFHPGPDEDIYPVVEIAWQQGVLPEKGFDLIVEHQGVCPAITMLSNADLTQHKELRIYCVKRLVRTLHDQLLGRLRNDLHERGRTVDEGSTLTQLLAAFPDPFPDDLYHIDVSHLQSVVQMAFDLPPGQVASASGHREPAAELDLAIALAEYGSRLSPALQGDTSPPFDAGYRDYHAYLEILAGRNVEAGLNRFRAKLADATREQDTRSTEFLVNLLVRLDRLNEALAVAHEHLVAADVRYLSCPSVLELAQRARNYAILAEAARSAGDPVNYLAALIATREVG